MPFPKNKFPQHAAVFPDWGKVERYGWTNFTITPTPFFISATAPSASWRQSLAVGGQQSGACKVMQPAKIRTGISETTVVWMQNKQAWFQPPRLARSLRDQLRLFRANEGRSAESECGGMQRNWKTPQISVQPFFQLLLPPIRGNILNTFQFQSIWEASPNLPRWHKDASKGAKRRRCCAHPVTPDWTAFVKRKTKNKSQRCGCRWRQVLMMAGGH